MAQVDRLDELELSTFRSTEGGVVIRCRRTSYDRYPTPLSVEQGNLSRPAEMGHSSPTDERRFPRSVMSWLRARPADIPFEIGRSIWEVLVGSDVDAAGRVTIEGGLAFELAEVLPPLPGCVVCVRLGPAMRCPASLPLEVFLQNTPPESPLVPLLRGAGGALKARFDTPASNCAIVHVDQGGDWLKHQQTPCRLLCVHLESENPWRVLDQLQSARAHAILVVSGEADQFFAELYRKLLHDEPIDRAVKTAAQYASPRPHLALGLRPGGETDLLLCRVIAEQSGLLRFPERSHPEWARLPKPPRDDFEGGLESLGLESSGLERVAGLDEFVATDYGQTITQHYAAAMWSPLMDFAATLVKASTNPFHHEDHSLREFGELAGTSRVARAASDAASDPTKATDASRYTQAWFERDRAQQHEPLPLEQPATLAIEIATQRREGAAVERFPIEAVAEFFKDAATLPLDIELYGAADDWRIPPHEQRLELPAIGASDTIAFEATPLRVGQLRLRVCVYHRNLLVQSMLLVAWVGEMPAQERPLAVELDYLASTTFQELDRRPRPVLSIFENDSGDTHWIGVREPSGAQGQLYELPKGSLSGDLRAARDALSTAHIECSARYGYPDPNQDLRRNREQQLVELAKAGFNLRQALFSNNPARPQDAPETELAGSGGLISIARLRGEAPAIPWQMIYDRPLYPSSPNLELCPRAIEAMASGPFTRCAAACPKKGSAEAELTVCPLGFWGLRHRIEQPLGMVAQPKPGMEVSDATVHAFFSAISDDIEGSSGLHIGYNASLGTGLEHATRLAAAEVRGNLGVAQADDEGASIRAAIRDAKRALFYFYCHGKYDPNGRFFLEIGSGAPPDLLGAADLSQTGPARPFFVVLNVCNSVEARSDQIHSLVSALRQLGALGVISTETAVREEFGKRFGERLVTKLGQGISVGQAFFDLRWELLCEAADASAFVYSLNGSAALRFVNAQ